MVTRFRMVNLLITAFGSGLFAFMSVYLVQYPDKVDAMISSIAISETADRINESALRFDQRDKLDSLKDLASTFSEQLESKANETREAVEGGLDDLVVDILTAACSIECTDKDRARNAVDSYFKFQLAHLSAMQAQIETLVKDELQTVFRELRSDLKIFALSNTVLFLFAFLLALFKGRASAHLLPVSISLTGATLIASWFYLFQQDWLQAVVFSSYWGIGYLFLVGTLLLFLIDIALNKARITTQAINVSLSVIGSAASLIPC